MAETSGEFGVSDDGTVLQVDALYWQHREFRRDAERILAKAGGRWTYSPRRFREDVAGIKTEWRRSPFGWFYRRVRILHG